MLAKQLTRKQSQEAESEERVAEFWRRRSSTASRLISAYAEVEVEDDSSDDDAPVMYRAEAMHASKSSAFRSGYPVLSFEIGEQFDVVLEEADSAEGGAGWLLGRKVNGEDELGWGRTEDFAIAEGSGSDEEER